MNHKKDDIVYYWYIDFDKHKTNKDIKNTKKIAETEMTQDEVGGEVGKNIRVRFIQSLPKYVCIDTDDKKSNDFMVKILNKYNIKGNCYPSISNYFKPDLEENSHKNHYWFETELPITSHIHVNNTLLDIWGSKCYYTNIKHIFNRQTINVGNNGEDYRIIFEPNVKGYYFDDSCKKYPFLTSEMYDDIMNINLKDELFTKKKVPSCLMHKDCIAFERFKCLEESGFKRDGYSPMSDYHKKILNDYQCNNKVNTSPLIIDDLSRGVICCVNVDGSNDPFIAVLRMKKEGRVSSYWGLPKGHPKQNESEISNAVRETLEEIGIDVCKYIHEDVYINDKYTFFGPMHIDSNRSKMQHGIPCLQYKEVKYFLAVLPEKVELKPQLEEVLECKWIRLSELKNLTYPNTNKMLINFFDSKKVKSKLECKTHSNSPPPLLQKLFEKTFSKHYYQAKFKGCDNTMPLYNGVKYNTNTVASAQLVNNVEVWAKVVSVYDGDTFYTVFQLPDEPIRKYKVRLCHDDNSRLDYVDAPELDSKDRNEKMKACASKQFVEKMILNKIVRLKIKGNDHYGRILADVSSINGDDTACLSEIIIQNNHAKKKYLSHFPKKKVSKSELLIHIKKESKQCEQLENQDSKPRFNILDPFHLFDNKKKTVDKVDKPLEVQQMENQDSKPRINILDPFHLFDNKKKTVDKVDKPLGGAQQMQNREERVDKKGFFDLFKKK